MSSVDLVFYQAPLTNPAGLVFGATAGPLDADVAIAGTLPGLTLSATVASAKTVTLAGTLPGLTLVATVNRLVPVTLAGTLPPLTLAATVGRLYQGALVGELPGLTFAGNALYASNTDRPTVGRVVTAHQVAQVLPELGAQIVMQEAADLVTGWAPGHQDAAAERVGSSARHSDAIRTSKPSVASHQDAVSLGLGPLTTSQQDSIKLKPQLSSSFQEAADLRSQRYFDFQDMQRHVRPGRTTFYGGAVRSRTSKFSRFQKGVHRPTYWQAAFQAARPPNGGFIQPPVTPQSPCYTPDTDLLFSVIPTQNGNLLFFCETHGGAGPTETIYVPIRSVYVVINDIYLKRVTGNVMLPALSVSLSIDADSWTWGFSASLPASALDDLQPESGSPVELEASINGNVYRVIAEQISRERSFGDATIRVSGRGKSAILSSPYAPVLTFANSQQRTAQQLMADVLTYNNVPIGWDIDWNLTDWTVPADAFNVRGTYIDGLLSIAGAAGAYLQPHPTLSEMSVLLRYPVAPWDWASDVTPDFQLPSSVTLQEGIEWLNKPEYNRVFVSGTSQGVIGQVTITGTAGDLPAQMVTDPLITHVDAARQRGLAVLGDTGKQARVRLRLPVLPATGIITPGKFVEYVDGLDTRLGLVRSTSVDAGWPEVWQSIELETHL